MAMIAFAGCADTDPPVDHEKRVGSPVSIVAAAAPDDDDDCGDALDCDDDSVANESNLPLDEK